MDTARFLEDDIYDEFSTQQGSRSTSIYLDNLLNFGLKKRGAAGQYMQFGQIACTFRISYSNRDGIIGSRNRSFSRSAAFRPQRLNDWWEYLHQT